MAFLSTDVKKRRKKKMSVLPVILEIPENLTTVETSEKPTIVGTSEKPTIVGTSEKPTIVKTTEKPAIMEEKPKQSKKSFTNLKKGNKMKKKKKKTSKNPKTSTKKALKRKKTNKKKNNKKKIAVQTVEEPKIIVKRYLPNIIRTFRIMNARNINLNDFLSEAGMVLKEILKGLLDKDLQDPNTAYFFYKVQIDLFASFEYSSHEGDSSNGSILHLSIPTVYNLPIQVDNYYKLFRNNVLEKTANFPQPRENEVLRRTFRMTVYVTPRYFLTNDS